MLVSGVLNQTMRFTGLPRGNLEVTWFGYVNQSPPPPEQLEELLSLELLDEQLLDDPQLLLSLWEELCPPPW